MQVVLIIIGAVALIVVGVVAGFSYVVFRSFLKRFPAKQVQEWEDFVARVENGDMNAKWTSWLENLRRGKAWFFGLDGYEKLSVTSGRHRLVGHYAGQNAGVTAIILHGYGSFSRGEICIPDARVFYDMGYNVFLPDIRGHGESDGRYFGMGRGDDEDVIRWINELNQRDEACKFVL